MNEQDEEYHAHQLRAEKCKKELLVDVNEFVCFVQEYFAHSAAGLSYIFKFMNSTYGGRDRLIATRFISMFEEWCEAKSWELTKE